MFRASSDHFQEDTVVHIQHMVLSLSMRVLGGLSVHSVTRITGTLHKDQCTFVRISRSVLLITRNVSDKISGGNQNTHSVT